MMNAKTTPISIAAPAPAPHPFWGGAFRPMFLFAGLIAVVAVVWWVAGMAHGVPTPSLGTPSLWHGHEMISGLSPIHIPDPTRLLSPPHARFCL